MKKLITSAGVVGAGIICLLALDSSVNGKAKTGDVAPVSLASASKGDAKMAALPLTKTASPGSIPLALALKEDGVSATSPANVAVVSTAKLGAEYYKAKEANANCASAIGGVQKELASMADECQKMFKEYNDLLEKSKNPALTEEAKKKAREAADSLKEALAIKECAAEDFKAASQTRIVKMIGDSKTEIMQGIKQKVSEIARARGIALVFDGDVPFIFFAEGAIDITGDVLTALNADRPAVVASTGAGTAAAPVAPAPAVPVAEKNKEL
ncbi:MAG: OmpH family outer membrane protein [Puniceicoccales bacterium]|nr:OmpH family outer membrane protein [Puniceicoccales bacterium]